MPSTRLLLTIRATPDRYIVWRDHVLEMRQITSSEDLARPDERGRSLLTSNLGRLLNPGYAPGHPHRHALIVSMRRRSVAFLVERVEDFLVETVAMVQPLPPLLARRLARPWFLGVMVYEDTPLLVLDLRHIAHDLLIGKRA